MNHLFLNSYNYKNIDISCVQLNASTVVSLISNIIKKFEILLKQNVASKEVFLTLMCFRKSRLLTVEQRSVPVYKRYHHDIILGPAEISSL